MPKKKPVPTKRYVRYFNIGGHDGGKGGYDHVPGVTMEVTQDRWEELSRDKKPYFTLRNPLEGKVKEIKQ